MVQARNMDRFEAKAFVKDSRLNSLKFRFQSVYLNLTIVQ